jgi:dihydrofolate reductase
MTPRKLAVFNNVSLDGYFTDAHNDMSFFKRDAGEDREFDAFVAANASGESILVFGRVTYEMMASFWPSPAAAQMLPEVAKGMNASKKIVFSRTLSEASWNNTTLINRDAVQAMRELKEQPGPPLVILGSGSLVAQLTQAHLIDKYLIMLAPVVAGAGRTMFESVTTSPAFKLTSTRSFANGNVYLTYEV